MSANFTKTTLPLLVLLFSTINIIYMFFTQCDLYQDFIIGRKSPFIPILFAYFAWIGMSYALKKYVIEDENFNLLSAFTKGPMLGMFIYLCINISLLAMHPDWPLSLVLLDIIFGATMFGVVTLIVFVANEWFT